MSKPNHPTALQSCLTSINKKIIQPTKGVLKSEIVRSNITEPTKKLVNEQPFIKEYITDPMVNASTGKTASDIRWVAKGAKEGVKYLTKPFLAPGLTEADVEDSAAAGNTRSYMGSAARDVGKGKGKMVVEAGKQAENGGSKRGWDEDTWEDDEDSVFKNDWRGRGGGSTVVEVRDGNGQIHMGFVDSEDPTSSTSHPNNQASPPEPMSQPPDEITFSLSDPEKVLAAAQEHDRSVRFQMSDMEFDRFINPVDIANFAKARGSGKRAALREFEPVYECWRDQEGVREEEDEGDGEEEGDGEVADAAEGYYLNRERVYSRDEDGGWDGQTRQTSRGTYEEAENVKYISRLMNRDGHGGPLPYHGPRSSPYHSHPSSSKRKNRLQSPDSPDSLPRGRSRSSRPLGSLSYKDSELKTKHDEVSE